MTGLTAAVLTRNDHDEQRKRARAPAEVFSPD